MEAWSWAVIRRSGEWKIGVPGERVSTCVKQEKGNVNEKIRVSEEMRSAEFSSFRPVPRLCARLTGGRAVSGDVKVNEDTFVVLYTQSAKSS
jgi:hypothetical protein